MRNEISYTIGNTPFRLLKPSYLAGLFLEMKGKKGVLIKWSTNYYDISAPSIKANSPVGSGDASVTDLVSSIYERESIEENIRTPMTAGILNGIHERTGYIGTSIFQ